MRAKAGDDAGFGIAEALVAILLFGILAVALVPPIILALQVSARATIIATASQVANERIELARAANGSCSDFHDFLRAPIPTYDDARGVEFTVNQTPSAATASSYVVSPAGGAGDADSDGLLDSFCDGSTVDVISFNVDVVSTAPNNPDAAQATTLIAVPGFGD
ncbi:type II secretion system protein [Demequina sp.]|uniref:type II secretion system protein n=1 Tax=Demequina sp. TaxID=2050685 RepID=UPI0025C63EDA|nr:type II secretion system protein [Demequina sp.]